MPEAVHVGSGKVREIYALGAEELLLVASDRISTFDVVLPTEIPDKGRVLTGLSAYWFARTRDIVDNHLLTIRPDGRSLECRRLEMLPVELVVRAERMRANVDSGHGLYFSQRLLLALVESGLSRDVAYRLVQRHAMRAWEEELDFQELVRADTEVAARVDLGEVFDLGAYTAHVDTVLDRLRALADARGGVHA